MDVDAWLAGSIADAERRGLTELVPLLKTLARATEALRAADAAFGHPAAEYTEEKATEYTDRADSADRTDPGSHGRG